MVETLTAAESLAGRVVLWWTVGMAIAGAHSIMFFSMKFFHLRLTSNAVGMSILEVVAHRPQEV